VSDPLAAIDDGRTALSEEDQQGLLPTYIATRGELADAEQRNIAQALLRRAPPTHILLEDRYLRGLHKAMFGQVWAWAGTYRIRETDIGIDPTQISVEVRSLVDDAQVWVECATYEPDELAARFHHRIVTVRPFPNGNGRHGRVAADYLISALSRARFSWGAGLDASTELLRGTYHQALHEADLGNIAELLAFARS
jgi:Fic-DOC domain mobile mystery protein B